MIRTLILYYLSIKATHGYEIQRFIQLNHMDEWTKIQSGSIYYALGKLEKEGSIVVSEEVGMGKKARKIYDITSSGKKALQVYVKGELDEKIASVGSDKFLIYPLLNVLNKEDIKESINKHIVTLKDKQHYLEKWASIKITENTLKVEKISFEMMIQNIRYQILWHEALLEELDDCINQSGIMERLIKAFDFSTIEDTTYHNDVNLVLSK